MARRDIFVSALANLKCLLAKDVDLAELLVSASGP